jgi:hypothetical protein
MIISDHTGLPGICQDIQGPYGTTRDSQDNQGPYGTTRDSQDNQGLCETTRDQSG